MKKTLSIMLVVLFALSLMGTVFAAPDDIFKDVPANHWSYAAVKKLAKAGIVGGYGDGTFRGSATISRYEMAIIVANAMTKSENADAESKELINKLASEYANEMQRIGARVDRLEAYNKSTLRVGADALMTFASDQPAANLSSIKGDEAFMWRVRFWFSGDLNDKTKFLARIATGYGNLGNSIATSTPSVAFSNTMVADVAQFTFSDVLGLDTLKLGRQAVNELGGNVLQRTGSDDGIAISKKIGDNTTIRAGAFVIRANNSTSTAFDAQELQYASLTAKVNDGKLNCCFGGLWRF
ncbi:MAG: hypothetical protein H6Q74_2986 [Firmicutes bacterium]|nr:hypothetical protein [Bacillota bacterium]